MTFNEANTVEAFVRDLLCGGITHHTASGPGLARVDGQTAGLGWHYLSHQNISRELNSALVETHLREALIRLNPEIAAQHDRADDVIHRLRAIIAGVRSDGLVKANSEFAAWLTGQKTMPFGENGEHVTIKLIDFEDLEQNQYVVTQQFIFRAGDTEKRADLVLLVNGMPLVLIEAKTPVRASETWLDGAVQVHDDYERHVPELFVPNVFSVATDGREYRYGSIRMPVERWAAWRLEEENTLPSMAEVEQAVTSMLQPRVILELLEDFTAYVSKDGGQQSKIIARYQQYEGAKKLVQRVVDGYPKRGLLWHFQGSGKSLLMLFAARKLRMHPELGSPTVIVVLDRVDLDAQISATFHAAGMENLVNIDRREALAEFLSAGTQKVAITRIFTFGGETQGVLNERENIIVLVDEAHRTQEGDLGRKMRKALPNAFLFGLTGTPINRLDKNTFAAFGAEEDEGGYMSRYDLQDALRDGATLPLNFEPRLAETHVNQEQLQKGFDELTADLTDEEQDTLGKKAAQMGTFLKTPERVASVCADIAKHYTEKVAPNGFGAQVVTFDREACVLYKKALDEHLPSEVSDIVMSVSDEKEEFAPYRRSRNEEEELLSRFKNPDEPLKILIVTAKLLTGFDAPILQTMYLDKPLKNHTLLQAICRTNRPYGQLKDRGLIVDYLGAFNDIAQVMEFDEESVKHVITNIAELQDEIGPAIAKCLAYFPGVDRTVSGYEGLIATQECLPDNDVRDAFAKDCRYLMKLWEAISPDPILSPYEEDYRWLVMVYNSVRPVSDTGRLLWAKLGEKTTQLIHENVHMVELRDDLDTLVVDTKLLEDILGAEDAEKKVKEIEIKVIERLRRHLHDPRFKKLAERVEELREKHDKGLLTSATFLKELLALAKDVVEVERDVPPVEQEERGKAALSDLFENVRNDETPIIVEHVVADIDAIVRQVRFDSWQQTNQGEREVRVALRKTLLKYQLHQDEDLFERAYGYIREYY